MRTFIDTIQTPATDSSSKATMMIDFASGRDTARAASIPTMSLALNLCPALRLSPNDRKDRLRLPRLLCPQEVPTMVKSSPITSCKIAPHDTVQSRNQACRGLVRAACQLCLTKQGGSSITVMLIQRPHPSFATYKIRARTLREGREFRRSLLLCIRHGWNSLHPLPSAHL